MTKEQIEEVLERVRTWSEEDQERAAFVLLGIEDARPGPGVYELDEEELADIEEGLAEAERGEFATDEEVRAVFNRYRRT